VLANNDIVRKYRIKGKGLVYEKYPFYYQHKDEILRLALNKKALQGYSTSYNPSHPAHNFSVKVALPKSMVDVKQLTVDDIDSFAKVRKVNQQADKNTPLDEKWFKEGLKRVIGEEGAFQDWGGEKSDLFSTRLRLDGKRVSVAIGFKGKGTREPLVPKKMGKRGDQIQRLMGSEADVFLVQFWGQIDESIIEQMQIFARVKSWAEGRKIYYGVIDGQDTRRIMTAYQKCFP